MKRILLKAALAACAVLAICAGMLCIREYQDRQQCVCSMLTEEEQTFSLQYRTASMVLLMPPRSGVLI